MMVSKVEAEERTISTSSRCSGDGSVSQSSSAVPISPVMGVRISWLMVARKAFLARDAASAARVASRSSSIVSSCFRAWSTATCSCTTRSSSSASRRSGRFENSCGGRCCRELAVGAAAPTGASKRGPSVNGSRACFTWSASPLKRSATTRGISTFEKRITTQSSPLGRSPPVPTTERTPAEITKSRWSGTNGLPSASRT